MSSQPTGCRCGRQKRCVYLHVRAPASIMACAMMPGKCAGRRLVYSDERLTMQRFSIRDCKVYMEYVSCWVVYPVEPYRHLALLSRHLACLARRLRMTRNATSGKCWQPTSTRSSHGCWCLWGWPPCPGWARTLCLFHQRAWSSRCWIPCTRCGADEPMTCFAFTTAKSRRCVYLPILV